MVEGETGLLVSPGLPAELAQAMLNLFHDTERSKQMGFKARKRIEDIFDIRRMVAKYEEMYGTL